MLHFTFDKDIEGRVGQFESVVEKNEVGFSVIGTIITTQRVKGLIVSGIALYGTATSVASVLHFNANALGSKDDLSKYTATLLNVTTTTGLNATD